MLLTAIVILLLLASAAAFALVTVARVRRAYNKRRLLAETPGVTCDGIDCMGISAVCSGITDEKQIENLLSVEYARYEVVLVLDAQRDTQAFRRIAARYQLIGVNCHPSEELPAAGIRGLYRSRQRCYRRLVLLDRAHGKRSDDFDAGVSVATYDYILPLRGQSRLMPRAVERLVVELSEHPPGSIALVRSFMGDTALLFARERVVRAREVQAARFAGTEGVHTNAMMNAAMLREYCRPDAASAALLERAMERLSLSARAYDRILKAARTIADLAGRADIVQADIAEAINYRSLDRGNWGR